MKVNASIARKYSTRGEHNINKGDVVIIKNNNEKRSKQLKRLGHIGLLTLAQRRNAPARDIKKMKNWFLSGKLQVSGGISHDTRYLYDEGGNILNHTNFGNKKTLTAGQEREKYKQSGIL